MLFFDPEERVLLVDPVYKPLREIPGGAVEWDESPRAGAVREVKEELGLEWEPGRLLGVDWRGARPGRSEGLAYVFDGGVLSGDRLAGVRLQEEEEEELGAMEFVAVDRVRERLVERLAVRVETCVRARGQGLTAYLEYGGAGVGRRGPGRLPPPSRPPLRLREDPGGFGEHRQDLTTGGVDGQQRGTTAPWLVDELGWLCR